jgi:predicted metal-binding protein
MKRVRSEWQGAILVCRKCTKKLDGGFGEDGRLSLAKLLKRSLGLHRKRKSRVGVVEVGCLDICPKRAVVAIDTRRPGEWQIVEAGLPAAEIAEQLGL